VKNLVLDKIITLGSLFDGIGGFVYAASLYGVKTLWASEIIPPAISVTRRHFPDMEHVGDITKLRGGELTPVHIITFGSPCQSFSIAGGRKGLEGKSGLFWEAIRIIKEMREATNGQYPRYCVFENVPGILSANRGRDYKTVLEAFTETKIPMPPSGKWTNAGMVRGGRIDLAWVIHDAQYFGVAQRRRRLFAVCDFTGQRAAEILFKPKSLYWYFTQSGEARKGAAPHAPGSVGNAERTTAGGNEITSTLYAAYGTRWNGNAGAYSGDHFVAEPAPVQSCLTPWDVQSRRIYEEQAVWPTLYGGEGGGHGYVAEEESERAAAAFLGGQGAAAGSIAYNEKVSPTLKSGASGSNMVPCVCEAQRNMAYSLDSLSSNSMKSKNPHSGCREVDVAKTIDTSAPCPSKNQGGIAVLQTCEPLLARTPNVRDEGIVETENAPAVTVINDQGGDSLTIEKTELSPTLRSEAHGNLPIVSIQETYPINTQIATRHKALGKGTGFGIGENGDPAYTLQEAHSHAVAVGVDGGSDGTMPNTRPMTMRIRAGCEGGGKGALLQNDKSGTLATGNDQILFCVATSQANAELCHDLCPTITEAAGKSGNNKPYIALGVNQNAEGSVRTAETAYSLTTSSNASSRNAPLICHPEITGTLCASGAGLSRPAGMANETDLCVVVPDSEPIPIQDKATRYTGGGDKRRDDGAGNGLGVGKSGDPVPTITSRDRHAVAAYCLQGNMIGREDKNGPQGGGVNEDVSFTLNTTDKHAVAAVDCRNLRETEEISGTLQAKESGSYSLNYQNPVRKGYIVRRLTPTECERLQGYGDGWTEHGHDGKPLSDTARYQALGNSVAIPCVAYVISGIVDELLIEMED